MQVDLNPSRAKGLASSNNKLANIAAIMSPHQQDKDEAKTIKLPANFLFLPAEIRRSILIQTCYNHVITEPPKIAKDRCQKFRAVLKDHIPQWQEWADLLRWIRPVVEEDIEYVEKKQKECHRFCRRARVVQYRGGWGDVQIWQEEQNRWRFEECWVMVLRK